MELSYAEQGFEMMDPETAAALNERIRIQKKAEVEHIAARLILLKETFMNLISPGIDAALPSSRTSLTQANKEGVGGDITALGSSNNSSEAHHSIISPVEWSRFYAAANICLCPLSVLQSLSSFVPMDSQLVFILPQRFLPLCSVVFLISLSLAIAHFFFEESPQTEAELITVTQVAFGILDINDGRRSFWISTMAESFQTASVLAWENSVDWVINLVADVALAKAGQPAMAMAGCFVGPMFNMLIGLGAAIVIETARVYPEAYELRFNVSIVVAFVFLLLSLMGSLFVVTWFRFRVPRFWDFCLVGLHLLFTAVSIAIARFLA